MSQRARQQPADRLDIVGSRQLIRCEQLTQIVHRQPSGHPCRVVIDPLDRRGLGVVLVGDLSDDLFENVLDGHQPSGSTVLVDDDRHVGPGRLHLP